MTKSLTAALTLFAPESLDKTVKEKTMTKLTTFAAAFVLFAPIAAALIVRAALIVA